MEWFAKETVVVTGAAHGIGRGIATLLHDLGARVIAVDTDEAALRQQFDGDRWVICPGDLGSRPTGELAEEIWQRHGPLRLLVNNVGIGEPERFADLDERTFDLVFNTNLRGPWYFTRQIVRHLIDHEAGGAIVFVSSLHATRVGGWPHYSASKAAMAMLVKELAHELGPHSIRVNAVSPGSVRSRSNPATSDSLRRAIPLRREGEPIDVARVVALLLSDEWAGYVTGVDVPVDGGLGLLSWMSRGDTAAAHGAPERTPVLRALRRTRHY